MPVRDSVITELQGIFPQHGLQTITYICDDVLNLFGNGVESEQLILPSCIERLLELPDDFVVPLVDNPIIEEVQGEIVQLVNANDNGNNLNLIPNASHTPVQLPLPSIRDSDDEDSNSGIDDETKSNHDDELNLIPAFEEYRSKERPKYRDKVSTSSNSSLSSSNSNNYFPNDSSDDLMLLEDISTPQDKVRHEVYDMDDIEILEGDAEVAPHSNAFNVSGKKRKQKVDPLPQILKKRKTPLKKESGILGLLKTTPDNNQKAVTDLDLAKIREIQAGLKKLENELLAASRSGSSTNSNTLTGTAANTTLSSSHTITSSTPVKLNGISKKVAAPTIQNKTTASNAASASASLSTPGRSSVQKIVNKTPVNPVINPSRLNSTQLASVTVTEPVVSVANPFTPFAALKATTKKTGDRQPFGTPITPVVKPTFITSATQGTSNRLPVTTPIIPVAILQADTKDTPNRLLEQQNVPRLERPAITVLHNSVLNPSVPVARSKPANPIPQPQQKLPSVEEIDFKTLKKGMKDFLHHAKTRVVSCSNF